MLDLIKTGQKPPVELQPPTAINDSPELGIKIVDLVDYEEPTWTGCIDLDLSNARSNCV